MRRQADGGGTAKKRSSDMEHVTSQQPSLLDAPNPLAAGPEIDYRPAPRLAIAAAPAAATLGLVGGPPPPTTATPAAVATALPTPEADIEGGAGAAPTTHTDPPGADADGSAQQRPPHSTDSLSE
jgi:hypothetical protein